MKAYMAMALALTAVAGGMPALAEQAAPAEDSELVKLPHLTVDTSARRIVMDTAVSLREGFLEHLVCKVGTKEYESILHTEAEAAHLHAALLMLDLTPGKPAEWVEVGDEARVLPPRGGEVTIKVRWKDSSGEQREAPAGYWLKPDRDVGPPGRWVFVGSEVFPDGRYWADVDGDVITVANFDSAVLDVPFESTDDDEMLLYEAHTERIPPKGTPVEVIIEPVEGAESADHARALLEIDGDGRLQIDGEDISADDLSDWAEAFRRRHSRPRVVIRPDPEAMMWDVTRARSELRFGGVRDFDLRYRSGDARVVPRTSEQVGSMLDRWRERFSNPQDFIRDPGEESEEILERVNSRIERLETHRDLLEQYAEQLEVMRADYKAAAEEAE